MITHVSADKDECRESTLTTESLAEEEEYRNLPREWIWRRRRQRSDTRLEKLTTTTTTSSSVEEDGPKGLVTTIGASTEKSLKTMRPRERRLGLSQGCNADGPKGSTTATGASA